MSLRHFSMRKFLHANIPGCSKGFMQSISGSTPAARNTHLLLPIKDFDDIDYGMAYARRHSLQQVAPISVLHVVAPTPKSTSPSSFFYQDLQFDNVRAEFLLQEAEHCLKRADFAYQSMIRSGEVVFSILDAAELLNCTQIVLPFQKHTYWSILFSSPIIKKLCQAARGIPIILVDRQGHVAFSSSHKKHMLSIS